MNEITIRTWYGFTVVTVNNKQVVFTSLKDAWRFIENVKRLIMMRRLLDWRCSWSWVQERLRELYGPGGTFAPGGVCEGFVYAHDFSKLFDRRQIKTIGGRRISEITKIRMRTKNGVTTVEDGPFTIVYFGNLALAWEFAFAMGRLHGTAPAAERAAR